MNKKIFITLFTLILVFFSTNTSICIVKDKNLSKDIWINNIEDNNLKIKILDVNVSDKNIDIGKKYNAFAIITMRVENTGAYEIELSNIDVYPFQGSKPTKYFVNTSEDNITGFLGNLKGKESKNIKMGIALYNKEEPIKLELSNIENTSNEKSVESISIK